MQLKCSISNRTDYYKLQYQQVIKKQLSMMAASSWRAGLR